MAQKHLLMGFRTSILALGLGASVLAACQPAPVARPVTTAEEARAKAVPNFEGVAPEALVVERKGEVWEVTGPSP
jgi:hypothetical protein